MLGLKIGDAFLVIDRNKYLCSRFIGLKTVLYLSLSGICE